jgi:hypothetical protein
MSSYTQDHNRQDARDLLNKKKKIFTSVPNPENKAALLKAAQDLCKVTYFSQESVMREVEEAIASVTKEAVACD